MAPKGWKFNKDKGIYQPPLGQWSLDDPPIKRKLSAKGRKAISDASKKMWAKKKGYLFKLKFDDKNKEWKDVTPGKSSEQGLEIPKMLARVIEKETNAVTPGKSVAKSSKKSIYYHDIPPELFRRIALRYTVGHTKHNDNPVPITMNLNWRIGLNDPLYVMDRLNHMFEHMVDFLDNGNINDDNLGAIAWCCGFLMEVERLHPGVLNQVIMQSRYTGQRAELQKTSLQDQQNEQSTPKNKV